jgi:uncharacterized protein with ParB-like and HNH nuclease domain
MAELTVSRKTILSLFTDVVKESKTQLFIIPEYQRPYSWDMEKCDILWSDIQNFHQDTKNDDKYFLGTIVTCKDESGINIIDGQQRITSFFLLLRAFYKKLEEMLFTVGQDDEIEGLMSQIAPCIWDVNPMSKKVQDKNKIHIHSLVATEKDNDAFHHIMINGKPDEDDKSQYAENYTYFLKKCNEYASTNPLDWKQLCLCLLNDCIVLPIECTDIDSALIIFSTLNDRGMPLSDSDIFKAEIYKYQSTKELKDKFTQDWKNLTAITKDTGLSVDDVFKYYTHILRAEAKNSDSEIGLRKFYAENKFQKLHKQDIMATLLDIASFWNNLLKYDDSVCTEKTKKYINCLKCYPNEYWKYPVTVLFDYCKRNKNSIKEELSGFLEKLLSYLLVRFVESQTVNTIKTPVYQFCIDIYSHGTADFTYTVKTDFAEILAASSVTKIQRTILLLNTYLFDDKTVLLPETVQIEHIFPQSWDSTYFNWSEEDAALYLNTYGNKIPFEWKLNIKAGNNFYSKKKIEYGKSQSLEVLSLCNYTDWTKESIINRSKAINVRLLDFFIKNLKSEDVSKDLLCYKGGSVTVNIRSISSSQSVSFIVETKDDSNLITKEFSTFEDAIASIDKGLLKFGNEVFIDKSIRNLVSSIKE